MKLPHAQASLENSKYWFDRTFSQGVMSLALALFEAGKAFFSNSTRCLSVFSECENDANPSNVYLVQAGYTAEYFFQHNIQYSVH